MNPLMHQISQTANFTYDQNERLGQGATAMVYKGHRKSNGQPCAVKVLSREACRNYDVHMRELEVLKKFSHPNIVQLFAIEEDHHTRSNVIVMELCDGGSLLGFLDEPANAYGLGETEFLIFLRNIADGLKYLRDRNVVHRDIKPGNIMRCIKADSRCVYKLTDFGAARELDDINSTFQSIYGTEEYLHPDMYKRALLHLPDQPHTSGYNQKVDLWSLGVTVFHTATGDLPFKPFGGRLDKDTMYKMTTEKETGVISGIQNSHGGPIHWSKALPDTAVLSRELKARVTPMLAGLMECDYKRMWTFERFFMEVETIEAKVPMHVFGLHTMELHTLYISRISNLAQLTDELVKVAAPGLETQDIVLLYQGCPLNQLVELSNPVHSYPPTCPETPLVLVPCKPPPTSDFSVPTVAPFPVVSGSGAPNYAHDTQLARLCLNTTHAISMRLHKFHGAMTLAHSTVLVLRCQAKQEHVTLKRTLRDAKQLVEAELEYCRQTEKYYKAVQCVLAAVQGAAMEGLQEKIAQLADAMANLTDQQERLNRNLAPMMDTKTLDTQEGRMEIKWTGQKILQKANTLNWCGELVVLKGEMEKLAKAFRERYGKRAVTHQQRDLHKSQKRMLHECSDRAMAAYTKGGNEGAIAMHENLQKWMGEYHKFVTDIQKHETAVERIKKLAKSIHEKQIQAHSLCTEILESLPEVSAPTATPPSPPEAQIDSLLAKSEIINFDQEQYKEKIKEMVTELEASTGGLQKGVQESMAVTKQLELALDRCMNAAKQAPALNLESLQISPNMSPQTSH